MAESLRQFCGDGVDVERVVSEDTTRLLETIASQQRSRRGRHARTQARDDNGQFAPEQD